jgi:hypothetical protein
MKKSIIILFSVCAFSITATADPLIQQFKDPAFNGVGWSSHVLTVQSAIEAHKTANDNVLANAQAAAAAASANTPLAKFVSLFTSQVYSQLATQLSNNLFNTDGPKSNAGNFVLDGNTISYVKNNSNVTLTVVDVSGNKTVVTVPIATFAF